MQTSLRSQKHVLDAIDIEIVKAVASDARISLAALARAVGLSAPSVSERLRRLEDVGAITGYRAEVNPEALGMPLSAYLRIRPIPGQLKAVANLVQNLPEIVSCDRVTGEDCFIARAHLRSVAELEMLIDRINPYAMTNTSIVQSSPVHPRLPPLEAR
ncbi:MAG: Lrp/AsnC family transcriptional regulator [Pseudomonadota bacterium]